MTLNRRKTLSLLGAGASAGVAAAAVGGLAWPGMAAAADELGTGDSSMSDALIIDDFTQLPESTIGGRWSYTSDRVMGGVSNGGGGYDEVEGRMAIRLFGQVSTANNGGFIQVRSACGSTRARSTPTATKASKSTCWATARTTMST